MGALAAPYVIVQTDLNMVPVKNDAPLRYQLKVQTVKCALVSFSEHAALSDTITGALRPEIIFKTNDFHSFAIYFSERMNKIISQTVSQKYSCLTCQNRIFYFYYKPIYSYAL